MIALTMLDCQQTCVSDQMGTSGTTRGALETILEHWGLSRSRVRDT